MREIGDVALPTSIRRSRLYSNLVDSTLRFLIERVGQVEGAYSTESTLAESALAQDFLKRRAVGNGLELAGILAFHASPVWVLAALADLSGAGRHLIREITDSLKQEGLLAPETQFDTMDQVLDGLELTAAKLAETINTPPLDVQVLRQEWDTVRRHAARIPPRNLPSLAQLEAQWNELQATAANEDRTVLEVSALLALSAVRGLPGNVWWLSRCARSAATRTGGLLASTLLDHYRQSLDEIRGQGYFSYWLREFRPYLRAAALQFSLRRGSFTQKLLGS